MDNEKELKLYLERVIALEVTIYKQKKSINSLEKSAQEKIKTGHIGLVPYPDWIRQSIEKCDNFDNYFIPEFYPKKITD